MRFRLLHVLSGARRAARGAGFSLVELLVALVLTAFLTLSISNFLMKNNLASSSLSDKGKEITEIQMLIDDLRTDLQKGAYISNNSYTDRLEYTIPDADGNALKKIYKIETISGKKYLRLSLDHGSTWISPYRVSAYTNYELQGTPRFLYAGITNNCTAFVDTNADLVYTPLTDATPSSIESCPASSGVPLTKPSEANRISLNSFYFKTKAGMGTVGDRPLATNVMIAVAPGLVRSTTTPLPSPAVKDPLLVQSFVTNTANSLYDTAYTVRGVAWDRARRRLLVLGDFSSGSCRFFWADRNGVRINDPIYTSVTTLKLRNAAIENDGKTAVTFYVEGASAKIGRFDVSGTTPVTPSSPFTYSGAVYSTLTNLAYDPHTPDDVYLVLTDAVTSKKNIYEMNKTTGALVTSWSLPASLDSTAYGFDIEPVTGDFLLMDSAVNGSGANRTVNFYRITRAGVSSSFTINIADLGISDTTSALCRFAYDPETNRIFLASQTMFTVYEVALPKLISPRQ